MSKPSIPQGTRDFPPAEVRKRQYIFNTLKNIFELYGFQPLETPAMENLVTLTGKYGEEGDRLIFKVLNNGLHEQSPEKKIKFKEELDKILDKSYSTPNVTERALRYDLTIPFARYVVMHQNELVFPFRRYQMQPVWRADRPQKGRYREFWQCDADIVGSDSLINEAELLAIYTEAFKQLKIPVILKVNSRKILAGLAEVCGVPEKLTDLTIALDKLDKIGWDGVVKELEERNIPVDKITVLHHIIKKTQNSTHTVDLQQLKEFFVENEIGLTGIAEIENSLLYFERLTNTDTNNTNIKIDLTLARGLNYYTGIIVEVVCSNPNVKMGSIGGGGRYDDLTGLFGVKGLSGVGVSFGIDRIYDVMEELCLFPEQLHTSTKVIILNFGGDNEIYGISILKQMRNIGIVAEMYPDSAKFDKQMKYANKRNVPYVILTGETERLENKISLKNMETGEQQMLDLKSIVDLLKTH